MFLDNDRKIANKAIIKADPQAVVPRQTLNSLLISAKAKINGVTSGDLGSEYNVYQRLCQGEKSGAAVVLTTKDDREFYSPLQSQGMR